MAGETTPVAEPRPGSRAYRMMQPLAKDVVREMAESAGVCIRPILLRRTDSLLGMTEVVEIPCGASLEAKCKPCAKRYGRLRRQQIREGWFLADEPMPAPKPATEAQESLVRWRACLEFERDEAERRADWAQSADLDEAIEQADELLATSGLRGTLAPKSRKVAERRARSTKRRSDAPDLPRGAVDARTVGKVWMDKKGKPHRASMLVTLTLDSYGPVHSAVRRGPYRLPCGCGKTHSDHDPLLSTPIDPATYDYRRAAEDMVHFARLQDRWWQNLRRFAGFNVQYAGAVELQKRLAPHGHYCVRGAISRC